jgi:hypothetical protein
MLGEDSNVSSKIGNVILINMVNSEKQKVKQSVQDSL